MRVKLLAKSMRFLNTFAPHWYKQTEAYRYLGCLVYIGVQPLREIQDHWHLETTISGCLARRHFNQIQWAFTISMTPPTEPERAQGLQGSVPAIGNLMGV
jgi:hypothetical protein